MSVAKHRGLGAHGGHFNVVAIPAMMFTASVGREVHAADGSFQTLAEAREHVQVVPLEAVVVCTHERASPFGDVADFVAVSIRVEELGADVRVSACFWQKSGFHEKGVHAVVLQYQVEYDS